MNSRAIVVIIERTQYCEVCVVAVLLFILLILPSRDLIIHLLSYYSKPGKAKEVEDLSIDKTHTMNNQLQQVLAIAIVLCVSSRVSAHPIMGEEPQRVGDVFYPEVKGVKVETWVKDLMIPWSLVFLPNGDALVTERPGQIQRIPRGQNQQKLYIKIDEVAPIGDGGLMGMALHPQFKKYPFVYIFYSYQIDKALFNRVIRLRHQGDTAIFDRVILDKIPGAEVHIGGRIAFGPDGMLYVGTGDLWVQPISQDLKSWAGKILRITPNGQIPKDNPFPGSPIYSYGHRVVQGLAWDPKTGVMFNSEHGSSGEWPGVQARDEINIVEKRGNYGWPPRCRCTTDRQVSRSNRDVEKTLRSPWRYDLLPRRPLCRHAAQ